MQWEELSAPRIAAMPDTTACVLPLGAVEQHGQHLPLGTDAIITESLAARLDAACGGRLLIMPVQRTGCSAHHMSFPGTLTLAHETFRAAVMDVLTAAIHHRFKRFLLLNGHGGNSSIGGVIAEQAACRWPEAEFIITSWWRVAGDRLRPLVEGEFPAVGHACEMETSLMLALRPELVDISAAVDDGVPSASPFLRSDLFSGSAASRPRPFERVTRTGAFGKPSKASAEKGRKVIEITTVALKELLVSCWPDAPGFAR